MTRSERDRLNDMLQALERCARFRPRLDDDEPLIAEMALDAILRNLAVVGEAAKALPEETRDRFKAVPWPSIAGLRNILVHEYFKIDSDIIRDLVDSEISPLAEAIRGDLASDDDEAAAEDEAADGAEPQSSNAGLPTAEPGGG